MGPGRYLVSGCPGKLGNQGLTCRPGLPCQNTRGIVKMVTLVKYYKLRWPRRPRVGTGAKGPSVLEGWETAGLGRSSNESTPAWTLGLANKEAGWLGRNPSWSVVGTRNPKNGCIIYGHQATNVVHFYARLPIVPSGRRSLTSQCSQLSRH